ncbi:hypothetical protein PROVRETT_07096 [Providencia rettgeri DSM 1131]|uniref:fimbrial protein n=1 Tax=Providencia rettgeri TaxID=587 RepID=UPI000197C011|nr:type 1 fimbrial protein [Providencia rettgeri]EFE54100.1 hypothetical protein PROVRETT_07096 [Providencia rettgeri DSM 1131]QXA57395.1 type 1 fimbrial protein [Providencia rettgeri]
MNMKSKVLTTALFAAIGMASVSVQADPSDKVILKGIITDTTCNVEINGGNSNLFVGGFRVSDFTTAGANTQVGSTPMDVEIKDCTAVENGHLVVSGTTSNKNPAQTLFVDQATNDIGFMIKDAAGAIQMQDGNLTQVPLTTVVTPGSVQYSFQAGMGTAVLPAVTGSYSAPVHVTFYIP